MRETVGSILGGRGIWREGGREGGGDVAVQEVDRGGAGWSDKGIGGASYVDMAQ